MQFRRLASFGTSIAAAVLLAACGGGGGGGGSSGGISACDVPSQKNWLRSYMLDWYYWTGLSPNPEPAGYATVDAYLDALRFANYPGARGPLDPWSYVQDSASYNQFFAEGRNTGYGVSVNGLEGQLPLKIRYVEPLSPAGLAGLRRGDVIKAINGVPDMTLIGGDFSVLSGAAGQQITLDIDRNGAPFPVTLTAADYALTPVPASATLTAGTAQVGYIVLKDFIVQAEPELSTRLNAIKAAGATDLIIDLRYNGGGRISTANHFASEVVGPRGVFTTLQYNSKQQASNRSFTLTASTAPGVFNRIVVLTGARSCSASELLINGLRPYAQQVSTVGDTSCGKPYGFNPVDACGNTFSIVNFKAVNARGQGDYEAGITPTCAVAEDFSGAFGDPAEKLTAAALGYLQTGGCPATATAASPDRARALAARLQRAGAEPGEHRGMTAD